MLDGVVRQIADGAEDHGLVAPHQDPAARQRHFFALGNCDAGDHAHHVGGHGIKIHPVVDAQARILELGDLQKLAHHMAHHVNVGFERGKAFLIRQRVHPGAQHRQGRAQFMRRVGGEFLLQPHAFFQPVQRLVDRHDQGRNSRGRPASGRRRSVRLGSMALAMREARTTGCSARRMITISTASSSARIATVNQPMRER